MAIPKEPIIFNKAPSLHRGGRTTTRPSRRAPKKLDWEVELGIVIGQRAQLPRPERRRLDVVAGYCLANDVSEREFQIERCGQWTKGKSWRHSGRSGPGWSPRTRSRTCRVSTCGSMSTARASARQHQDDDLRLPATSVRCCSRILRARDRVTSSSPARRRASASA